MDNYEHFTFSIYMKEYITLLEIPNPEVPSCISNAHLTKFCNINPSLKTIEFVADFQSRRFDFGQILLGFIYSLRS